MHEMISVEVAKRMVLDHVRPLSATLVDLSSALGATLAADVVSDVDVPPFANAAMDGFVTRLATPPKSLPVRMPVHGEVRAGHPYAGTWPEDALLGMMTGAPIPRGTFAVIQREWVTEDESDAGHVWVHQWPEPNQHIRPAAKDLARGARCAEAGERITPSLIGMMAMGGAHQVHVTRAPRIGILSTGDELVEVAQVPGPGQIRNSNGPTLSAQVMHAGAVPVGRVVADDEAQIAEAVASLFETCDFVVGSGGVSVGKYDLVRRVLEDMGVTWHFWRVKQRPGKPLAFGTFGSVPFLGLPGNPVSASIGFEQYVRPAIRKMLGQRDWFAPLFQATLTQDTPKVKGLHFFARAVATPCSDGTFEIRDTGPQGSNLLHSMARANAIMHLDADLGDERRIVPAGTRVRFEFLPWTFQ